MSSLIPIIDRSNLGMSQPRDTMAGDYAAADATESLQAVKLCEISATSFSRAVLILGGAKGSSTIWRPSGGLNESRRDVTSHIPVV